MNKIEELEKEFEEYNHLMLDVLGVLCGKLNKQLPATRKVLCNRLARIKELIEEIKNESRKNTEGG